LQVYNEETGVIVATVTNWLGLQQQDVIVKVRHFEHTALLDVEAPDANKAQELLAQIATYVTDGAGRVQADATIQWIDIERKRKSDAQRKQLSDRARAFLSGQSETPAETLPTVVDEQGRDVLVQEAVEPSPPVPIPDNPGVLVKNYQNRIIELKVDPVVFADRSLYLELCRACSAAVMRGSRYCPSCGRPLTLEAVQPELQRSAHNLAGSSLRAGTIALVAALVPVIVILLPQLVTADASLSFLENLGQSLTPIRITLALLLGLIPALTFGWWAVSQSQQAGWYQNLDALFDQPGRLRATLGRTLGWIAIYTSVAWVLFGTVALLFR
jgi:hypothetical protein